MVGCKVEWPGWKPAPEMIRPAAYEIFAGGMPGCPSMVNDHVVDAYDRVVLGAPVTVH